MESIIVTKNLGKFYGKHNNDNWVIDDLNLKIKKGDFVSIMGSSGTGKTTLLNILSGLDNISKGEVWIKDHPIHSRSEKDLAIIRNQHIGFVFQSSNLIENLTALENVLIAGYIGNRPRNEVRDKASALFSKTELSDLKNRLPGQLSTGQQQRVSIIRALINQPDILMVDEPTGNLNSSLSSSIMELLSLFNKEGQTILMVTHDVISACYGQCVLYFKDGNVTDELRFQDQQDSSYKREKLLTKWLLEKGW